MAKTPKLNPLDQAIQKWVSVFSNIDGYRSEDEDLRYAGTFIATKLLNLEQTRLLTINNFVPAVNKAISDTKQQLSTSIYKRSIKTALEDNLQVVKEDTIRLGYVMFFHKYENFVKDYVLYIEKRSLPYTLETGQTLLDFCKTRFGFSPFTWWKYPVIHQVNFISNCTKHHDGKCKLDNPKNTKPIMYASTNDTEVVKPDIGQFKDDTARLIQFIGNNLVQTLENANMIRVLESLLIECNKTIAVYNEALSINEAGMKETFIHDGMEYPVLTGADLQTYIEDDARYKAAIVACEQNANGCKDKITAAGEAVKLNIKLMETEVG